MRAGPCEERSVNSEVTPVRECHETPPLTTIRAYSRMYSVETNSTLSGRLHVPIVGPTGRSDWSVRLVGPIV